MQGGEASRSFTPASMHRHARDGLGDSVFSLMISTWILKTFPSSGKFENENSPAGAVVGAIAGVGWKRGSSCYAAFLEGQSTFRG